MEGTDANGETINFCDIWGNRLTMWRSGLIHVHTIIPKRAEELYQLWALIVAVISLSPLSIKDVIIPFLQWLLAVLN